MGLMDKMNYRMQNPEIVLPIDEEIMMLFISKERDKEITEQFALWASLSNENVDNKLISMLDCKTNEQRLTK